MKLTEVKTDKKIVVCFPGRFQPFHIGHYKIYKWLKSKFRNVYIVTSDKVEYPKSPFNFDEKQKLMRFVGVDKDDIVQVKSPYRAVEVTEKYNPDNTVLIYAVSEKDMDEDPRFSFEPKQDGSASYFQPMQHNPAPLSKHAYILTVPTFEFKVLDNQFASSTEIRNMFAESDRQTQAKIINDLYNKYNKEIHKMFLSRLKENLAESIASALATSWHNLKPIKKQTIMPEDFSYEGLMDWFNSTLLSWKRNHRLSKRVSDLVNPYWPSDYMFARAIKAGADIEIVKKAWRDFRKKNPKLWAQSKEDQEKFNIQRQPSRIRDEEDLFESKTSQLAKELDESYKAFILEDPEIFSRVVQNPDTKKNYSGLTYEPLSPAEQKTALENLSKLPKAEPDQNQSVSKKKPRFNWSN